MSISGPKWETLCFDKLPNGLIPAIIQDAATMQVLMLGYMNEESYRKTLTDGRVCFFSRTRQALWTKGETSGNFLNVVSIAADCDRDTLLIRVIPQGPVCHTGAKTCFGTSQKTYEGFLRYLETVIADRRRQMPEGSYTTKLFNSGVKRIAKKVGEEASETILEAVDGNRASFIYEAGDLMYHLLVLMQSMGVTLADIEEELEKRHQ